MSQCTTSSDECPDWAAATELVTTLLNGYTVVPVTHEMRQE